MEDILLLGVTAVAFGFIVLAWIVYNVFWERQPQVASGLFGLAGGVVMYRMIAVGWNLIRMSLRRSPPYDGTFPELPKEP